MGSANRLPAGVRDFLPRAAAQRRSICGALFERFDRWGYQRIITPQFEVAEVIERGMGPLQRRDAVRFIEPGTGDVVALRPDITPQVARIAATRLGEIEGPLRLSYEGAVTRAGGARVQREILQAGIELIGAGSPQGDAEALALAADVLRSLGVAGARLEIGHVGPTQHVLDGAPDDDARRQLRVALERRELSRVADLAAALPTALQDVARALPRLTGDLAEMETAAARLGAVIAGPLAEVRETLDAARELAPEALEAVELCVDFGELRSFPYYTGVRLAGWLPGTGDAVLVGGRYDSLVARFGRQRQATGFAVDVEAVAQAQAHHRGDGGRSDGVLVVGNGRARALAASLRAAGHRSALEIGGLEGRESLVAYAEASGLAAVLVLEGDGAERLDADGAMTFSAADVTAAIDGEIPALRALVRGEQSWQ